MKVIIQNQHGAGKVSKKWDKTGLVLENLGYNKYRVKVDGSDRVTDRNRQFLRQFTPATSIQPGPRPDPSYTPEPELGFNPQPVAQPSQPTQIIPDITPEPQIPTTPKPVAAPQLDSPLSPESPSFATPPTTPVANSPTTPVAPEPPRRSTRINFGRSPDRLKYDRF